MNFLAQSLFPFTLLQTCIDRCFETCVNYNSLSINGFTTLIKDGFTQCVNPNVTTHYKEQINIKIRIMIIRILILSTLILSIGKAFGQTEPVNYKNGFGIYPPLPGIVVVEYERFLTSYSEKNTWSTGISLGYGYDAGKFTLNFQK